MPNNKQEQLQAQEFVPTPSLVKVQPGDTLSGIATQYGLKLEQLVAVNQFENPNLIYPGQMVRLTVATPYLVQPGDTLSEIAGKNKTTVDAILGTNPQITNPNLIYPGQKLLVSFSQDEQVPLQKIQQQVGNSSVQNLKISSPSKENEKKNEKKCEEKGQEKPCQIIRTDSVGLKIKDVPKGQAVAGGHTEKATFALAQVIQKEIQKGNIKNFQYFSAFDDAFHHTLSYHSVHVDGRALDFTLQNGTSKQYADVANLVKGIGSKYGINLIVLDESKKLSKAATAPHIHAEFKSEEDAKKFLEKIKKENEECKKKKAKSNDGALVKGTGKDPCDKSKMTKDERFIYDHREAIKKTDRPELVGAIMLDELQRRDFWDSVQETEARFIDFYEGPFESVERWLLSNTFKPIEDISLGPAQIKPKVVYELVDQGFIKKPKEWDEDKVDITIKWLLNPGSSATLVNARLEQIVQHWAKGGVDISNRPDVLGTLYSIGLVGKKGINPTPEGNERGKNIADNLMKRVKELLSCPPDTSNNQSEESPNKAILKAAGDYKDKSTIDGPGTNKNGKGGQLACAWAINKVLSLAGIEPLGGNSPNRVDSVEQDLKLGRGELITDPGEYKAGDLAIIGKGDKAHIGVCLVDGCTKVLSNSSSKGSFNWESNKDFHYTKNDGNPGPYNNFTSRIYRVKN